MILRLAARLLGRHGARTRVKTDRERVRAQVDRMRLDMGLPPIQWPGRA